MVFDYKPPKNWVITTVKISPEFHKLCKIHSIKFSEAARVGISVMLAERGVMDYDNRLNIFRMLTQAKLKTAEFAQQVFDLQTKLKKYETDGQKIKEEPHPDIELDEVFNAQIDEKEV